MSDVLLLPAVLCFSACRDAPDGFLRIRMFFQQSYSRSFILNTAGWGIVGQACTYQCKMAAYQYVSVINGYTGAPKAIFQVDTMLEKMYKTISVRGADVVSPD